MPSLTFDPAQAAGSAALSSAIRWFSAASACSWEVISRVSLAPAGWYPPNAPIDHSVLPSASPILPSQPIRTAGIRALTIFWADRVA